MGFGFYPALTFITVVIFDAVFWKSPELKISKAQNSVVE
jgi:hypothetical protein